MRRVGPPSGAHPYLGDGSRVLAFAHRGGARHPDLLGLENTMAAFSHAVALGYGYLETDVHLTSDGVLLAFHDDVLDRVTDSPGRIADLTHADVQRALIGGREPVPTLAEVFDAFPGARFNIDLKSPGAVAALAEFIEDRGAHDRVLVGSFSSRRLRAFRRLTAGRVATSAAKAEVLAFWLLPSGRLARLLTGWAGGGRIAVLQIPHRAGRFTVASTRLIRRAHRAGIHVHVWTVDDAEEMRELIGRGVDGLMTDRTDILKSVLTESGLWEEHR